jgi:hypothetical protein
MVASLKSIQSLPENHPLRSANALVEATAEHYMNHADSTHERGHYEIQYGAKGFDGARSVSGFPLPNGVLFGKTNNGFTLFDPNNEDMPGLKFEVNEIAGKASISVASNSRKLTNDLSNTAKAMLSALGFDDKAAGDMLSQAATSVQHVQGHHADNDVNVGAKIKRTLNKSTIEENLASHMGERAFPIGYKNDLEAAHKPQVQAPIVETAPESAVFAAPPVVDLAYSDTPQPAAIAPAAAASEKPKYYEAKNKNGVPTVSTTPGHFSSKEVSQMQGHFESKGLTAIIVDGNLEITGFKNPDEAKSAAAMIQSGGELAVIRKAAAQSAPIQTAPRTAIEGVAARTEELAERHNSTDTPKVDSGVITAQHSVPNLSTRGGRGIP